MLHPETTGPDYADPYGDPAQLVSCPDCGQIEWWTGDELIAHGKCRVQDGDCPVCVEV